MPKYKHTKMFRVEYETIVEAKNEAEAYDLLESAEYEEAWAKHLNSSLEKLDDDEEEDYEIDEEEEEDYE